MSKSDKVVAGTPLRIGLLLIDGFALMSYAAFIEPFRAANSFAGRELFAWQHITLDGREARASSGARLIADGRIGDPIEVDLLMVFAGGAPSDFRDTHCFAWLRMIARRNIAVGGISGGPYLLARAGLLGGHRVTIHWEHAVALAEEFPALRLEPSLYVVDRGRITCAGGTAGLDLAIRLIEDKQGVALARQVGEWFIRSEARRPDLHQRPSIAERYGTHDPRIIAMLEMMEADLETPPPRARLAAAAGMSLRHAERLFEAQLGRSMAETSIGIRLEHGAQLLRSTGLTITEIALACGFRTPSHFSRRFAARFGYAPSHRRAGGR